MNKSSLRPFSRRFVAVGPLCALLLFGAAGVTLTRCAPPINPGEDDDGGGQNGDGGNGDGSNQVKRLSAIRVQPDNDVLQVDVAVGAQATTKTFKVVGVYTDGSGADLTAQSTLTLTNPAVGQLAGPVFTAAKMPQGKVSFTTVKANYSEGGQTYSAIGNLTLVWLRASGNTQDFFFSLPYNAPKQNKPLSFTTLLQNLDSFFAVDTTGSMAPEIVQLSNSLQNTIIPGVKAAAAKDAWFGVGAIDDFPIMPFGQANYRPGMPDDQPFILLKEMTPTIADAQAAVGKLLVGTQTRGNGVDLPESQMEGLYHIATGDAIMGGVANVPEHKGKGIGGVEFRPGALPVVTMITDAIFHTKNEAGRKCQATTDTGVTLDIVTDYSGAVANVSHTRAETLTALNKICAKVIGVSALRTTIPGVRTDPNGICNANDDLVKMAVGTGAVVPPEAWDLPARPANCGAGKCCTGLDGAGENPGMDGLCPLVFKIRQDGSGLGAQVTSGITQLARFATFDVVTQVNGVGAGENGEMLPAGRTTADFVKSVLPASATPPPPPPKIAAPIISGNKFTKVTPGSVVNFTIEARNDFVMEKAGTPQVFRATIKILAGGCADLDQRDVIILIPPSAPMID